MIGQNLMDVVDSVYFHRAFLIPHDSEEFAASLSTPASYRDKMLIAGQRHSMIMWQSLWRRRNKHHVRVVMLGEMKVGSWFCGRRF